MGKKKKSASQSSPEVRVVHLGEDGRTEAYRMLARIILAEINLS